jgi:rhamnosyltransferase
MKYQSEIEMDMPAVIDPITIGAVIVTYRPDIGLFTRIVAAVSEQAAGVMVFDNSDDAAHASRIKSTLPDDVHYRWRHGNLGIGKAHNEGIAWAETAGFSHLLVLDQDSLPHPGMIERLTCAFREMAKTQRVAAVGSVYLQPDYPRLEAFFIRYGFPFCRRAYAKELAPDEIVGADCLISSGTLFSISAIHEVGVMRESLFIDHVDTEWFLRANRLGYRSFGVAGANMDHALGDRSISIWFGRWRSYPVHNPIRHYYIFRNSLLLYRMPHAVFSWIFFDLRRLLLISLFCALVLDHKRHHLRMIRRGIADGLRGRAGKLPHDLEPATGPSD